MKKLLLFTLLFLFFFDGKTQSTDTLYYPNTRIHIIKIVDSSGNHISSFTEYSEIDDTVVLVHGEYKNGRKTGVWKEGDSTFTYVNGIRNGPCIIHGAKCLKQPI